MLSLLSQIASGMMRKTIKKGLWTESLGWYVMCLDNTRYKTHVRNRFIHKRCFTSPQSTIITNNIHLDVNGNCAVCGGTPPDLSVVETVLVLKEII